MPAPPHTGLPGGVAAATVACSLAFVPPAAVVPTCVPARGGSDRSVQSEMGDLVAARHLWSISNPDDAGTTARIGIRSP